MNAREQRGLVIADTCKIQQRGKIWEVPSQSHGGVYMVNPQRGYCSCPDHAETGVTCKHQFAVRFSMTKTVQHADGSATIETTEVNAEVKRTTYRQKWTEYNAAQTCEHKEFQRLLYDLCQTLPARAEGKNGRPTLAPADAAFAAIFKVYSLMSARRFVGELDEAKLCGFISHKPHFNSVLNFLDSEETEKILMDFVAMSSAPLAQVECDFAVDSTGFSGCRYARWYDEKYGRPRAETVWVKVHAMAGVKTNVITSAIVHNHHSADAKQLPALVADTATRFIVDEVSADKAYGSRVNAEAVEAVGADFYPAFKKGSTGGAGGAYKRAFHAFCLNQDEYMDHYHKRSNIESTFSMVKRKFGGELKSKSDVAMRNEALAKIVCHNICCLIAAMHELKLNVVIKTMAEITTCTKSVVPAQQPLFN